MNELQIKGKPWHKLKQLQKSTFLTQLVGESSVMAVNFSKDRFVRKSWRDKTTQKWQPRKRKDRGSLLIRSGRLKRSIRKIQQGNYYAIVGTDVPYAITHNEGEHINETVNVKSFRRRTKRGTAKVRSHKRRVNTKIPQRKFLGASHTLATRIERFMQFQATKQLK